MICEATSLVKYINKSSNIFFVFGSEVILRNNSVDDINKCFKDMGFTEKKIITEKEFEIAKKKLIGWFQGKMEWGPRALGNRSILGDPRSSTMQKNLNLKVKYRESFRPFAPSVLREDVDKWFKINEDSPYMLLVAEVLDDKKIKMTDEEKNLFGIDKLNIKRSDIPAVTHVDYSARIQTVHSETNPKYYSLIKKFKEKTNCSVLINTSFNVRGEPIVNTPSDACLLYTSPSPRDRTRSRMPSSA